MLEGGGGGGGRHIAGGRGRRRRRRYILRAPTQGSIRNHSTEYNSNTPLRIMERKRLSRVPLDNKAKNPPGDQRKSGTTKRKMRSHRDGKKKTLRAHKEATEYHIARKGARRGRSKATTLMVCVHCMAQMFFFLRVIRKGWK